MVVHLFDRFSGLEWAIASGVLCILAADLSGQQAPTPPSGALSSGLTRLVFQEEFSDDSGIDFENTGEPGFNFYLSKPFGWSDARPEDIRIEDGIAYLQQTADDPVSIALSSIAGQDAAGGWTGFAADMRRGPYYFESSIRFDPEFRVENPEFQGGPGFWTMAAEHLYPYQAKPYRFIENDFLEYQPQWVDGRNDLYQHAVHLWEQGEDGFRSHEIFPSYSERFIDVGRDIEPTEFNVYGSLWAPGVGLGSYFNDELKRVVSRDAYPNLDVGDDQNFPILLGSRDSPMQIDWIRVWSSPLPSTRATVLSENFDTTPEGEAPAGWFSPASADAFVGVTREQSVSGSQSLKLSDGPGSEGQTVWHPLGKTGDFGPITAPLSVTASLRVDTAGQTAATSQGVEITLTDDSSGAGSIAARIVISAPDDPGVLVITAQHGDDTLDDAGKTDSTVTPGFTLDSSEWFQLTLEIEPYYVSPYPKWTLTLEQGDQRETFGVDEDWFAWDNRRSGMTPYDNLAFSLAGTDSPLSLFIDDLLIETRPVPAPGTSMLLGCGAVLLLGRRDGGQRTNPRRSDRSLHTPSPPSRL